MKDKLETRNFDIEIRAEEEEGKTTLRGYAAVFNSSSKSLGGFVEKIEPGAFKKSVEGGDIRAFWNHNIDKILGRTKSQTLTLEEDDKGLRFEIELPDTTAGKDAKISVDRGDVDGMSFGFIVPLGGDRWDKKSNPPTRTLTEVELIEVSPVIYPAYPSTTVALRSAQRAGVFIEAEEEAPDVVDHDQDENQPDTVDRTSELLQAEIDLLKL